MYPKKITTEDENLIIDWDDDKKQEYHSEI